MGLWTVLEVRTGAGLTRCSGLAKVPCVRQRKKQVVALCTSKPCRYEGKVALEGFKRTSLSKVGR
jgi:hypothetical protein